MSMKSLRILIQGRPTKGPLGSLVAQATRLLEAAARSTGAQVLAQISDIEPTGFDLVHYVAASPADLPATSAQNQNVRIASCLQWFRSRTQIFLSDSLRAYVQNGQPRDWLQRTLHETPKDSQTEPMTAPLGKGWDQIVTFSSTEQRRLREHFLNELFIPNLTAPATFSQSADPALFRSSTGLKNVVLVIGPLCAEMNQLSVLKALEFSELPVVFLVPEKKTGSDYENAIQNFKRAGKTVALFDVSQELIASAIADSRVVCSPGFILGFDEYAANAIAMGRNVVVNQESEFATLLGESVIAIDPTSISALSNGINAAYFAPVRSAAREALLPHTVARFSSTLATIYAERFPSLRQDRPSKEAVIEPPAPSARETLESLFNQTNAALQRNDAATAHRLLEKAETFGDQLGLIYRIRATLYFNNGNGDAGFDFLKKALHIDSTDFEAHWLTGQVFESIGSHAEAHAAYMRVLAINTQHRPALERLLGTAAKLNRQFDTIWYLRSYVDKNPGDGQMKSALAEALTRQSPKVRVEEDRAPTVATYSGFQTEKSDILSALLS